LLIGKVDPLIYVITGPMYSAKTRELISHLDKYKYADTKFQLFKPKKDDRYSETDVVTHTKELSLESTPVTSAAEIMACVHHDTQVVGIDEAQFFDSGLIDVCFALRASGRAVYVAGLDTDYRMIPFAFSDGKKNMGDLLAIADHVEKRTAICQERVDGKVCGAVARYTKRISQKKGLVVVGSVGDYIASCHKHHKAP
jgi:thymidine kinase